MGGILSSIFGETNNRSNPSPSTSGYQSNQYHEQIYGESYRNRWPESTRKLSLAPSVFNEFEPTRKLSLAPSVFNEFECDNWYTRSLNSLPLGSSVQLVEIQPNGHNGTYATISTLFKSSAQKHQKVVKIVRVENPYLLGSYLLKQEEFGFEEKRYFHGTKRCNVQSICENNFDWRFHGGSLGNRYGQGVSFSNISNYASHYCDKADDALKAMFVVRVLESRSVVGTNHMVLPPRGYDTAKKDTGHVIVKFYDSEYYPEYIIYFIGSPIRNPNKGHVRAR